MECEFRVISWVLYGFFGVFLLFLEIMMCLDLLILVGGKVSLHCCCNLTWLSCADMEIGSVLFS